MIYDNEARQKYPVFARMSDAVWNRVFKGQTVSDFLNENIIEMIEKKKPVEWILQVSTFAHHDIWLAIQDYHQLSSQEWHQLAAVFSVPDFWQEYIALVSGNLDYLNHYFFNDPQSFEKSFKEYDYQILKNAAENNHFEIIHRLLEIYPEDLHDIFKKRGDDIIRMAIQFGHSELVDHYLTIYPEGRREAFLNALNINQSLILKQFTQDEIDGWIKTDGDKIFRNAYLSGNVELFDKLLSHFSPEAKSEFINKYAFDALFRSVGSEHINMLKKIDCLLDTDELRSSVLHFNARKGLFESAVRSGNIEVCEWVRSIKTNDEDVFLGMHCLGTAQFQHDLAMVDYLIQYAESSGKIKEFKYYYGYEALSMGAYYGDVDIFDHLASKISPQDFVDFIKNDLFGGIYYDALARGHEKLADRIEDYAKRYGCWEDVKEQNPIVKISELLKQSPHIIQRFLETMNHLEKINYQEIKAYLADQWEKFTQDPHMFLKNYPQQIDAVMQYAIQTNQAIDYRLLQLVDIEKYEKTWVELAYWKSNDEFIISYLKLPGMFDKVYGDKESILKDYLPKFCPDECLTIQDRIKIENSLHKALSNVGMKYNIHLEDTPIVSLKISFDFKNAYEMELFKTNLGLSFPEPTQYPCQQTIDIYRKHGEIHIKSLSENLNQIQAQWGFGNSDPGFLVVRGISATMNSYESANISAFIKTSQQRQDYFCLAVKNPTKITDYEQELLERLITLFPLLCDKNNIEKIKGDWTSKRTHSETNTDYYEFNIKADDFHELMLKESNYYRGYRNSIFSVYQLAHPETQYYKPDSMCLFPIQPLESEMMIRNAGCNVSEVLSVQLSAVIQELFDAYKTTSIGGHHQSKIMDKFGVDSQQLITAALMCAGASADYIKTHNYHEAFDGLNVIPLTKAKQTCIQDMDTHNLAIYGVSANTKSELSTLKSFEVPMEEYLSALKIVCHEKPGVVANIQELIEKIQATPVSNLSK